MHPLVCLLAFINLALSSPSFLSLSNRQPSVLSVIWLHDKATDRQSLRLANSLDTEVYGASCSNVLDNIQPLPLIVNVTSDGYGQILVGDWAYPVQKQGQTPTQVPCEQFSNGIVSQLDCLVMLPGQLPDPLGIERIPNCFPHLPNQGTYFRELRKRSEKLQNPGPSCGMEYPIVVVRDGNPRKRHRCKQMTDPHACSRDNDCGVLWGTSVSTTFGFTITGMPGDAGWASAGFSVTETNTVSTTFSCTGNEGDVVCLWADQPYIEYTVRRRRKSTGMCLGQIDEWDGDEYRISSPLDNGDSTYCVTNFCRANEGDHYWEDNLKNCAQNDNLPEPDWHIP